MAAKQTPTPRHAPNRSEGLSARKVSEWVALIASLIALVGFGVDQLYSHWKKDEQQMETATALTLLKTESATNLAQAKSELSDRLTKVEALAVGIDKNGTDYGRSQYSTQAVERTQLKKDVADLQDTIKELAPALNEVKINVRWLMANSGAPDAVTAAQMPPRPRPRALRSRVPHH